MTNDKDPMTKEFPILKSHAVRGPVATAVKVAGVRFVFALRIMGTNFGKWNKRSNATPSPLATGCEPRSGELPRQSQPFAGRTWPLWRSIVSFAVVRAD